MNNTARRRRAIKTRRSIERQGKDQLTVYRSNKHIYVQVIRKIDGVSTVLAAASTNDPELKGNLEGSKIEHAKSVGLNIANKAKAAGVQQLAFDRAGYRYHGRIKALADGAREAGLDF